MALVLQLTFPAGRYHATPWGRHVNEGIAEWPPSPWRFLRALVAVWKRTAAGIPDADMQQLLASLADPPVYQLPPHRIAHTRHYMPWEKKGPADRTLVFDTFVVMDRAASLLVGWPDVTLDAHTASTLATLLANLTTFGRAESWVEATILAADAPDASTDGRADAQVHPGRLFEEYAWNCMPGAEDAPDVVQVLCADPAGVFAADGYPPEPSKGKSRKVKDLLFDAPRWNLCLDTELLHAARMPHVPGARWVAYNRPVVAPVARRHTVRRIMPRPTVLRFVLDAPVLPHVTEVLPVAEACRRAAMGQFRRWCERNEAVAASYQRAGASTHGSALIDGDSPQSLAPVYASMLLSGKDPTGLTLTGHGHAHYLPLPDARDGRHISEILIYARDGFDRAEVEALGSITYLVTGQGAALRVQQTGRGTVDALPDMLVGPSRHWISRTPFLGHERIGTTDRIKYLRKGIRREWRRLQEQIPAYAGCELEAVEVVPASEHHALNLPRSHEFLRARRKDGGREAYRAAEMFRLTFSRPVQGPLSLGYACHFGMGLFVPDPSASPSAAVASLHAEGEPSRTPRE